jgi:hypothetical protein
MRQGWALVRPDLVLWLALAALIAVATMSMPAAGGEPPPALPFLISVITGLITTMLPAVLFTAQLEGRQLGWGPVLLLMARKAAPLVAYAITGIFIAWTAEAAMIIGLTNALGQSPALVPLSTIAGVIIFVSILVRFSFLSFLVILVERDKLPLGLWQWHSASVLGRDTARLGSVQVRWAELVGPIFWPLTASSRLSEGIRWRLVPYTVLQQAVPVGATFVPAPFVLPAAIVAMLVLTTMQAVFFLHYCRRTAELGVPAPALPLEPVIA